MLAWQRAAVASVFCHLLVFILFAFTCPGVRGDYQLMFVFLGSMLRASDVVAFQSPARVNSLEPGIKIADDAGLFSKFWFHGVLADKPEVTTISGGSRDDLLLRFSGNPVRLDDDLPSDHGDIPAAPLMDLRLEHR